MAAGHRWIPELDQYQDLIVIFDDATSEVYDVQLVEEESTATVMAALKRVVRVAPHQDTEPPKHHPTMPVFLPPR